MFRAPEGRSDNPLLPPLRGSIRRAPDPTARAVGYGVSGPPGLSETRLENSLKRPFVTEGLTPAIKAEALSTSAPSQPINGSTEPSQAHEQSPCPANPPCRWLPP